MPRILSVDTVRLALNKKNPPDLVVAATGEVTSTGWSDIELSPYIYITPPQDGVWDFDFVGKPPRGFANLVILPVSASFVVPDVDLANFWGEGMPLKGVRVHSATGAVEGTLGAEIGVWKAL